MKKKTESKFPAWYWLTDNEKNCLLMVSPKAEQKINSKFIAEDFAEVNFFPFTPVGRKSRDQGIKEPWLPKPNEVVDPSTTSTCCITHPQDSSFQKYEDRAGMQVRVPKSYRPTYSSAVLRCMHPKLRKLEWSIYGPSFSVPSDENVYLECQQPGVNGDKTTALYVPYSYFASKNYDEVVACHMGSAVAYYRKGHFGPSVTAEEIDGWAKITEAALTSADAMYMRKIVEKL